MKINNYYYIVLMFFYQNVCANHMNLKTVASVNLNSDQFVKAKNYDGSNELLIGRFKITTIPDHKERILQILWTHQINDMDIPVKFAKPWISEVCIDNYFIEIGSKIRAYQTEQTSDARYVIAKEEKLYGKHKKNRKENFFEKNNTENKQYIFKNTPKNFKITKYNESLSRDMQVNNNVHPQVVTTSEIISSIFSITKNLFKDKEKRNNKKIPIVIINSDPNSISFGIKSSHTDQEEKTRSKNSKKNQINDNKNESGMELIKKNDDSDRKSDKLSTQITSNGCFPRVDEFQEKVITQNKILTYKNGVLIKESECQDSLINYPIKKDYMCSECQYTIDQVKKVAYRQYKKYWIDENAHQNYLSDLIFDDKDHPFYIKIDKASCPPKPDIEHEMAFLQEKWVFIGYFNEEVIAKNCHPSSSSLSVNIFWTDENCSHYHNLNQNWSIAQKRAVFQWKNEEFEVMPCQDTGRPIEHMWDMNLCQPSIDLRSNQMIPMGKRYILLDGKVSWIDGPCEPMSNPSKLLDTYDGCEGKYFHDFNHGKSYIMSRKYYLYQGRREYVSDCIVTDEFIEHEIEEKGFKHDDVAHQSWRLLLNYIDTSDGKKRVGDVYKSQCGIEHKLISNQDLLTGDSFHIGCHRYSKTIKSSTYQRPDGSTYQEFTGEGQSLKGPDECIRKTEKRQIFDHSLIYEKSGGRLIRKITPVMAEQEIKSRIKELGPDKWRRYFSEIDGVKFDSLNLYKLNRFYRIEKRVTTVFPSGEHKIGEWENTGVLIQNDTVS